MYRKGMLRGGKWGMQGGEWGGGGYFISKEKSNNLDNGQTNPSHYFFIGCRTAKVSMSS